MKKGFFKKGTALAISAAMAVSMLPTLNPIEKVDAATTSESTKTITGLRIAGITNPRGSNGETLSDTEKWTGSYVYYGEYNDKPIRFRVLDNNSGKTFGIDNGSMLLDCATILTADESDPSKSIYFQTTDRTDWNQSNIYQWLNSGAEGGKINNGMGKATTGFLTQFTNADREAIASSTKKSKNVRDGGLKTAADFSLIFTPLTDTKVFVLDSCELRNKSYGYPDKATAVTQRLKIGKTVASHYYWTRSGHYSTGNQGWGEAMINSKGAVETMQYGGEISPAFNVDVSKILFTSLVSGTQGKNNAEYKLTLLDKNMRLDITTNELTKSGDSIVVPYVLSGTDRAKATQVSYMVTNKGYTADDAKVLAYGKLANAKQKGSVTINLASLARKVGGRCTVDNILKDYQVYVFAEDIQTDDAKTANVNEGLFSDYASTPVNVAEYKFDNDSSNSGNNNGKKPTGTGNGENGIKNPYGSHDGETLNTADDWKGSYVYYGKYNGQPIKFRMLDNDSAADFGTDGSILLDCDGTLKQLYVPESYTEYETWLNGQTGFLKEFSEDEIASIAKSSKSAASKEDGKGLAYKNSKVITNQKVFVLTSGEATNTTYGYPDSVEAAGQREKGSGWMLRDIYEVGRIIGAASDITGKINTAFDSPYEMSPAFNVKKSAILFTSQVKKADADGYNAEYKLTLLDRDIKTTLGAMTRTGNVVRIPYSVTGEKKNNVNAITYVVTDKAYDANGSKILAYGKLDAVDSTKLTGAADLDLAAVVNKIGKSGITTDNILEKYNIYVVAEIQNKDDLDTVDVNEALFTDYASAPVKIEKSDITNTDDSKLERVKDPTAKKSSDGNTVIVSTETKGADIYYTTDGTTPSRSNGTKYTGPIPTTKDGKPVDKIKVIAVKDGMKDSNVIDFDVKNITSDDNKGKIAQVDKPTASLTEDKKSVLLSTKTEGADIYYTTDGTTPSKTNGKRYTGPIQITGTDGKTIKAVAVKSNMKDSDVMEFDVSALKPGTEDEGDKAQVGKPSVKASDDGTSLIITADPKDADIYYTTDGSTPSKKNGTKYTGPIPTTDKNGKTIDTIKVIGVKDNMKDSDIATVKVADLKTQKPTIAASGDKKTITVSAVKGATIYYTTDGSTPTKKNGKKYTGPIDAASVAGKTIKAIATLPGKLNSDVVSAEVSKLIPSTPVKPVKGQVAAPTGTNSKDNNTFTLATKTAGATIYYTTNGSYPTTKYGTKYTKPLTIKKDSATTITAIAVKAGMENSDAVQFVVIRLSDGKVTVRKEEVTQPGPKPGTKEADKWISSDKVDKYTKGQLTGRASATTSKVTLRWERLKEADGYIIYGNYCNKKNKIYKYKKIKTVSASKLKGKKNISYTLTKLAGGKKFKKNTFYKFKVIAYKNVRNSKTGKIEKRMIGKSFQLHTITATKKYKYNNPIGVTVKNTKGKTVSKVTVKKRKSVYLDATVKMAKNKKLKVHCEKVRWISTNSKIATVSQGGRIKGKKKGTCYVYALAQNGARKKLKITVK